MEIPRFEVCEDTDDHSFYINMLTVDEAGTTRRDTILDGFADRDTARRLAATLAIATHAIRTTLAFHASRYLAVDTINIPFRS